MLKDPVRYSTIRREPPHKPADGYSMSAFYDKLTSPVTVVGLFFAACVLINKGDMSDHLRKSFSGDRSSSIHLSLLALSLVAGLRLVHSCFLAKRDYAYLGHNIWDIAVFVIVILFGGGIVLQLVGIHQVAALAIYTLAAVVGAVNFGALWLWRIPRNSDQFDYPIERLIQIVNTVVFLTIGVALGWQALDLARGRGASEIYWVVGSCMVLLIFNIIHSDQLTMLPKYLLTNEADSPESVAASFRLLFGHLSDLESDGEIREAVMGGYGASHRTIRTVRVQAGDVDQLSSEIVKSFGYLYAYVLGVSDDRKLRRGLRCLLTSSFGFGALGYMNFYWVVNESRERVGLIRVDSNHRNWIYRGLEALTLPLRLAYCLRTVRFLGVLLRARSVSRSQPAPVDKEIRLTYLITLEEFRRRGYGLATVRLLRNACLHAYTNDIVAEKLSLYVRSSNQRAVRLFQKAGFAEVPAGGPISDPGLSEAAGRLLRMELCR